MNDYLLQLLDYERWTNQLIIDALRITGDPPERAVQLMGHILGTQAVWFARVNGGITSSPIWPATPAAELEEVAQKHHALWRAYVADTNAWQSDRAIRYRNSTGTAFENTPADILTHLSHHATYHRGQVVQLIRPQLAEAPLTDYIVWRRISGRSAASLP